tara:strand:- start:159770 stop:159958 length:189 start_codon:yes stop_codon:yes gene_type:complete
LIIVDVFFIFSFQNKLNPTKMKNNILGAIVIFFVTFASLLALSELSNVNDAEIDSTQFYAED